MFINLRKFVVIVKYRNKRHNPFKAEQWLFGCFNKNNTKEMNYRIILFFALISTSFSLFAQQQGVEVLHYIMPEFTKGEVLMKNGKINQALLNYNAATEEMIFDQNGQKLAFDEVTLSQVDTVFIQNRKFVLHNKKFVEVLYHNGYKLFVEYKCQIIPPGKPAAYGGSSETSSVTSYSSWMGNGTVYQLKLPDDYKTNTSLMYWFDNGKGMKNFSSLNQIKKLYKNQKDLYSTYTKDNKVDFKVAESVAALFHYMETNSQKQ